MKIYAGEGRSVYGISAVVDPSESGFGGIVHTQGSVADLQGSFADK